MEGYCRYCGNGLGMEIRLNLGTNDATVSVACLTFPRAACTLLGLPVGLTAVSLAFCTQDCISWPDRTLVPGRCKPLLLEGQAAPSGFGGHICSQQKWLWTAVTLHQCSSEVFRQSIHNSDMQLQTKGALRHCMLGWRNFWSRSFMFLK